MLSIGDPAKVSSWSNVPYFFSQSIELAGRTVHRVDIGPNPILRKLYDTAFSVLKKFGIKSEHDYFHGSLNALFTNVKIRKHLRRHPDSFPVFMTYTFGAAMTTKPYAVFSDRTFESFIRYFHDREPTNFESYCVNREIHNLLNANLVISLFPDMAETLQVQVGNKVRYYGNVVNLPTGNDLPAKQIEAKWENRAILFIGKAHYKEGFYILRDALNKLNKGLESPFKLDVIGLKRRDVGTNDPHISFHGYLDKSNPDQFAKYMQLMKSAFLFVNPNPRWASFSASCEALSLNTPLVLKPYPEFERTFGNREDAYWFLSSTDPETLALRIANIAEHKAEWLLRAKSASTLVKDFTWPNYTKRFLSDIDKL